VRRLIATGRIAASIGLVGLITAIYSQLHVNPATIALTYVVAILALATAWGIVEATTASVVSLLGFNDSVFALTRKTTDPQDRVKAVDRLAPWGATALYDVIVRAVDMLGKQIGRKALVVFTDGEDQGSHVSIDDVERKLQASDVTLYMIGQGRGITLEPLKKVMERLAAPTGGRALFTDSIDELHGAFTDLLDELANQYLLGYASPNSAHDDEWHRIKVTVDGRHDVRARQGYRIAPAK